MGAHSVPADRRQGHLLDVYVTCVSVAGVAVIAAAAQPGLEVAREGAAAFWLLAVSVLLGELLGVPVAWRDKTYYYTMSSPFTLALLSEWGAAATILVATAVSLFDDVVHRMPPRKVVFNAAQTSLAVGAAGLVYVLAGGGPVSSLRQLPAFCAAGVTSLLVKHLLVRIVVTLDRQPRSLSRLLGDSTLFGLTATITVIMPFFVLLAVPRRALIPAMLAGPILIVYAAFRSAMHAKQAQAEAEQQAQRARKAQAEAERQAEERARLLEVADGLIKQLKHHDRHRDEALAMVAHELRGPLSAVGGIAGSMLQHLEQMDPDDCRELLTVIRRHAAYASSQAERLLPSDALLRDLPGPGLGPPGGARVDAAEIARQAGRVATFTHPDRPVHLEVAGPLPVCAPAYVIEQVITNLVDNAVKYSLPGAPIWLEARRNGTAAVLAVEDEGPGLPEEERERVFDQFIRLANATHTRGLGLGLAIARKLARGHGGDLVAVEPLRPAGGARLELRLPLSQPRRSDGDLERLQPA